MDLGQKFSVNGHGQPAEVGTFKGKRCGLTKCFCLEISQKTGQIESSPGYAKSGKIKIPVSGHTNVECLL